MAEIMVNGVRYFPERKRHVKQRPFGELLRDARLKKQESLDDVAKAVGSSKSYIWELERGSSEPGLSLLYRILRHLNIEFNEISVCKK